MFYLYYFWHNGFAGNGITLDITGIGYCIAVRNNYNHFDML